jgi:hypothetical protein
MSSIIVVKSLRAMRLASDVNAMPNATKIVRLFASLGIMFSLLATKRFAVLEGFQISMFMEYPESPSGLDGFAEYERMAYWPPIMQDWETNCKWNLQSSHWHT